VVGGVGRRVAKAPAFPPVGAAGGPAARLAGSGRALRAGPDTSWPACLGPGCAAAATRALKSRFSSPASSSPALWTHRTGLALAARPVPRADAVGLAAALYRRRWQAAFLTVLWLTLPFVILAVIRSPRPFVERYLIFVRRWPAVGRAGGGGDRARPGCLGAAAAQ